VLWLGTDRGLLRFEPAKRLVRSYGLSDGLQDLEFNGGTAYALRDGRVLFGGVRGLNCSTPPAARQQLHAAGTPAVGAIRRGKARRWWRSVASEGLEVPPDAGLLRLRVGALDHAGGQGIRYRYAWKGSTRAG
jgi:hypothetical protein